MLSSSSRVVAGLQWVSFCVISGVQPLSTIFLQLESSGVGLNNSEIENFEDISLVEFMYLTFSGSNYVIFVEHKPLA